MVRTGVPPHVRAFVAHTMTLAQSGSTEEVVAAFFYGREDIIPEMFSRLQKTLPWNEARQRIACVILSITLSGTLSSMVTVTVQWGGNCSTIWSRNYLRKGTNALCAPRVQQHTGPDRALEWHIKIPSRAVGAA